MSKINELEDSRNATICLSINPIRKKKNWNTKNGASELKKKKSGENTRFF